MKEYVSLKDTNKQLKEQISKTIKCESGTSAKTTTSMLVDISASSSTNIPPMLYGRPPLAPYIWPCWSNFPNVRPCHEHDSPSIFCGSGPHFYLPPRGWFHPLLNETSGSSSQHFHSSKEGQEDPVSIQCGFGQSYRALNCEEKTMLHGSKERDPSLGQTIATQLEENATTSSQELPATSQTEHQRLRPCPDKQVLTSYHDRTSVSSSDVKGGSLKGHDDETSLDKSREACSYPNKKLLSAAAAAQARKRRKELTKLKQLHGRQAGLRC